MLDFHHAALKKMAVWQSHVLQGTMGWKMCCKEERELYFRWCFTIKCPLRNVQNWCKDYRYLPVTLLCLFLFWFVFFSPECPQCTSLACTSCVLFTHSRSQRNSQHHILCTTCVHLHMIYTKFESNKSLENYHMTKNR